jgi:hypothetical protein
MAVPLELVTVPATLPPVAMAKMRGFIRAGKAP